jgi:type I restriction enzyme M protein
VAKVVKALKKQKADGIRDSVPSQPRSVPHIHVNVAGSFSDAKAEFDKVHDVALTTTCIVPVNGKSRINIGIRDAQGKRNEEYFKWQFIHSIIKSGLYAKDYIGVEVQFPKGNSSILRLDGAIFDSAEWLDRYNAYWRHRRTIDLEWLNDHLLAVLEFKKNDKEIE